MTARDRRGAATAAQSTLKDGGKDIRVDGVWGARSQAAYDSAAPTLKAKTDASVVPFGLKISDLVEPSSWISREDLVPIVRSAAAATGLSEKLGFDFIDLEARKRSIGGVTYYDAASVAPSGLYHGLTQMGRPAWTDVMKAFPGTPGFLEGRYDPAANVLAGFRYATLNRKYLMSKGYTGPFTVEVMYAAHNQGAAGFMRLLKGKTETKNFKVQSSKAKQVMRTALLANGVVLV